MPVRSLNSSVLKWPDRRTVHTAATGWAKRFALAHPGVLRVGYFGSYAWGDSGVGSDLDVVVILDTVDEPSGQRSLPEDVFSIPVPVDVLVYSREEWQGLVDAGASSSKPSRQQLYGSMKIRSKYSRIQRIISN